MRTSPYVSLQVIVDLIDDELMYTLFYENEEFSSLEYESKLYTEIVKKVLRSRDSGEKYDIYITDIDLSPAVLNMKINKLQSSRYLYFKWEIEANLKKAVLEL